MNKFREFRFYLDEKGKSLVREFIENLQNSERTKVLRMFEKLQNELPQIIQTPYYKQFKHNTFHLGELKIDAFRFIVSEIEKDIFIVLTGFRKQIYNTPQNELIIAEKRIKHYLEKKELGL